jgi:Na+-translocating ferredoxin:NAD+ oxidoreductase RnfD subunit
MKIHTKQTINITTIIALFLIAMSLSPKAATQLIVFIALLAVVFGRDLLLKKRNDLSRDESVA